MDRSVFEHVASALTVKAICHPMGVDVAPYDNMSDFDAGVVRAGTNIFTSPSRVVNTDGSISGVIWGDDWMERDRENEGEHDPVISDVMKEIQPSEFLSSSTTILDAVQIFSTRDDARYFYVLDVNNIVGVVFYSDLFRPLGRLAFLALALEIENQALILCQSASLNEKCWQCISDSRKQKAIELFRYRHKREPEFEPVTVEKLFFQQRSMSDVGLLIGCTNLVDKATMIWKQKLITPATQAEVLGFFNDLKEIRDRCAHPGSAEELIPKERLAHFVASAIRMRKSLHDAMEVHKVSENQISSPAS